MNSSRLRSGCIGLGLAAVRFALLVACAPAALAQTSSADGPWSGSVQCVLDVQAGPFGPYARQETQTWTLTGAAPAPDGVFRIYDALWTVTGAGRVNATTWSINVPATPVKLQMFIRASDQKLIIQQWGARKQIPNAIASNSAPHRPLSEWSFFWIDTVADNDQVTIHGSKPAEADRLPADFFFSGAPVNATCTWQFTKGGGSPPAGPQQGKYSPRPPPEREPGKYSPDASPPAPDNSSKYTRPAVTGNDIAAPTATPANGPGVASLDRRSATDGLARRATCTKVGPLIDDAGKANLGATPGEVYFLWGHGNDQVFPTSNSVSRSDLGVLTPPNFTGWAFKHRIPLISGREYQYTITEHYADGSCGSTSVRVVGPTPSKPSIQAVAIAGSAGIGGTGNVRVSWGGSGDEPSGYLIQGPGIPAPGREYAPSPVANFANVGGLAAGTHTWSATPFWDTPSGRLMDPASAGKVTVQLKRYRVLINSLLVNQMTSDQFPGRNDGHSDEVYVAAKVWREVAREQTILATWKSLVHGDINGFPNGRVKAGTASPTGGLSAGNIVPNISDPTMVAGSSSRTTFPLLICECWLADPKDELVVEPTLWEYDGNSTWYNWWESERHEIQRQQSLYTSLSDVRDFPIGEYDKSRVIKITKADIDGRLGGPGLPAGMFRLKFQDNHSHGDYEMFLRFEPIP